MGKANLVGINHIALEVGDIEKALEFYSHIFNFTLRGRSKEHAFIDLGDQFIALMQTTTSHKDKIRHFGLVVDDRSKIKKLAEEAGAEFIGDKFFDFLDPWGNFIQVVEYSEIQFTKAPEVLTGMKLKIHKNEAALQELAAKGMKSN